MGSAQRLGEAYFSHRETANRSCKSTGGGQWLAPCAGRGQLPHVVEEVDGRDPGHGHDCAQQEWVAGEESVGEVSVGVGVDAHVRVGVSREQEADHATARSAVQPLAAVATAPMRGTEGSVSADHNRIDQVT
jgi:hypothetical protein